MAFLRLRLRSRLALLLRPGAREPPLAPPPPLRAPSLRSRTSPSPQPRRGRAPSPQPRAARESLSAASAFRRPGLRLRPRLRVQPRGYRDAPALRRARAPPFFLFPSRSFGALGSRPPSPQPWPAPRLREPRVPRDAPPPPRHARSARAAFSRRLRRRLVLADPRPAQPARRLGARLLGGDRARTLSAADHRVALGSRGLRGSPRRLRARAPPPPTPPPRARCALATRSAAAPARAARQSRRAPGRARGALRRAASASGSRCSFILPRDRDARFRDASGQRTSSAGYGTRGSTRGRIPGRRGDASKSTGSTTGAALFVAGVREGRFGVERGFQLAELGLRLRAVARGRRRLQPPPSFLEKDTGDSSGSGPGGSARSLAPTAAWAARGDAEAAFDGKRFAARSAATLAPDACRAGRDAPDAGAVGRRGSERRRARPSAWTRRRDRSWTYLAEGDALNEVHARNRGRARVRGDADHARRYARGSEVGRDDESFDINVLRAVAWDSSRRHRNTESTDWKNRP